MTRGEPEVVMLQPWPPCARTSRCRSCNHGDHGERYFVFCYNWRCCEPTGDRGGGLPVSMGVRMSGAAQRDVEWGERGVAGSRRTLTGDGIAFEGRTFVDLLSLDEEEAIGVNKHCVQNFERPPALATVCAC